MPAVLLVTSAPFCINVPIMTEATTAPVFPNVPLLLRPRPLLAAQLVLFFLVNVALFARFVLRVDPFFLAVRYVYDWSTLAFPLTALVLTLLSVWISRRRDLAGGFHRPWILSFAIVTLLLATRIYATHYEPHRLIVHEHTIATDKVTEPLRLLHITDLQIDTVGDYEREVFERIRELDPHLILHTGDVLQPRDSERLDTELARLEEQLETLSPPLGVYNVLGDVDYRTRPMLHEGLGGMTTLENEGVVVEHGNTRLRIYGLELIESRGDAPFVDEVCRWLEEGDPGDLNILMGHSPDYVLELLDLRGEASPDFCLAGHTHGGQIRIPFLGPIVTLSDVPRDWARGFREVGNTRLNVSAGLGSEHAAALPDIRVNCPPEMTLFHLVPAE